MDSITIRRATENDAEALLDIYSYYVLHTAITFEYDIPSVKEFQSRIRNISAKYPYLIMEDKGVIVGYSYAGVFKGRAAYDWAVETTIYLRKGCERKGYGRKLYAKLEEELAKMGILNAYACIGYPETDDEYLTKNSEKFHAAVGYKTVGLFSDCGYKFNRWYHMIWMEKMLGHHTENQAPIRPYPEISDL